MAIGKSGRIVIEIDPDLKQELYQSLKLEDSCLKDWFLKSVKDYLSGKTQLQLDLLNPTNKESNNAV